MGDRRFAVRFAQAQRPGAYLAIDRPGLVGADDEVRVVAVPDARGHGARRRRGAPSARRCRRGRRDGRADPGRAGHAAVRTGVGPVAAGAPRLTPHAPRGANMISAIPTRHSAPPARSHASGRKPSNAMPQSDRPDDEHAAVRGEDAAELGLGLEGRHDAVQAERHRAGGDEPPAPALPDALPHQPRPADLGDGREHEQAERLQDGHAPPPTSSASTTASRSGPRTSGWGMNGGQDTPWRST